MKSLQNIELWIKKEIQNLDWIHDYYFVYFLYKSDKIHRYYQYMDTKWGLKVQHMDGLIRINKN